MMHKEIRVMKMKTYEVIIDLSSKRLVVEAETKEEAEIKAVKKYEELIKKDSMAMAENYWVGECDEVA